MGWLFTQGASKADIIHKLVSKEENDKRRWETIAHCVRGNVLWAVNQITYKQDNRQERFIVCYLLRSSEDCGWGYKDMTESMFPYQFSCPLKYLDMVPVANKKWRAEVRAYHQRRNRKVQIGQKIGLLNASIPWVVITSTKPLLGVYAGLRYRVPRSMLGDVIAA